MADEPKLIVALEAKLDKFEKTLREAGLIAEQTVRDIEKKFEKASPQFGSTFKGTFLGNVASQAVKELTSFITGLVDEIKKLSDAADVAGITLERAFILAGAKGNLEATAASLEKLAALLDRARRGEENSLVKLFGANNIDVKNVKDIEDAWTKIVDLVSRAETRVQADEMLRAAGISKELFEQFSKGTEEMKKQQAQASALADKLRPLVVLADAFANGWREAWDKMREKAAEVLQDIGRKLQPLFDALAEFAKARGWEQIADTFERAAKGAAILAEGQKKILQITVPPGGFSRPPP